MGLDWNPGNRAKPGFEVEFADVFGRITAAAEAGEPVDALIERYRQISTTALETLGTPVVGRDPEADAWVLRQRGASDTGGSDEEYLARMAGFAVLPLVPPCDGLPRYTNGSPGGYVEAYAFRAQFLRDCEGDIGEDLMDEAYVSKLPDDLLAYGRQLLSVGEDLARRHGLDPLNLVVPDSDWSGVEHRVDVIHSAGRWCVFWAERGHLLDAYW